MRPFVKPAAMCEPAKTVLFEETQRWSPAFRAFLSIPSVAAAVICAVLVLRGPIDPAGRAMIAACGVVIPLALAVLLWVVRMETQVCADGVYVRYFPFHWRFRHLPALDLDQCFARTYRPILEYGGWGIRWGFGGRAYNIRGNQGVQLVFRNGRRLLLGSGRPRELEAAIRSVSGCRGQSSS